MRKNLSKYLAILVIIILCAYGCLNIYRYHTNSPMPDIEYKKAILWNSHNLTYNLEALRPVMGPEELTKFIKENDNNPQIYTPNEDNINSGKFRANLHMHTKMSDGAVTVKERMDEAEQYAKEKIKNGYMVIAITDHNTVNGAQEVIKILEQNPGKYDHIKVIPGIEINSKYHVSKILDSPVDVHVLLWAVNPYEKFLKKEFRKEKEFDKWNYNYTIKDFDSVINTMSEHGVVGIAHPARYSEVLEDKKYPYITEIFTRYKDMNGKIKFAEGYYQSYKQTLSALSETEADKYINYINTEAKRLGIIRTGSTDAHGNSVFKYK